MPEQIHTNVEVLREMVRLAENRRTEDIQLLERINQYNLALIAFAGSFLSLLVSAEVSTFIVQFAGIPTLLSIGTSLYTILPKGMKGGVHIDDDILNLQSGESVKLADYLLSTAAVTNQAAVTIALFVTGKKWWSPLFFLPLHLLLPILYMLMPKIGSITTGI